LNTGFYIRIYLLSTSDLMSGEEELAFLKAHLGKLSQGSLAAVEAGHRCGEEDERSRGCRQG
jgi:hypothetical protein